MEENGMRAGYTGTFMTPVISYFLRMFIILLYVCLYV